MSMKKSRRGRCRAKRTTSSAGIMSENILCALVGGLVAGVVFGGQPTQAQDAYPTWFKTMPPGDEVVWAVGYGPGYGDVSMGTPDAKSDAYEALRRAVRVVILGQKLYEAAPGYRASIQGEDVVEAGLPDTLRSVAYVDSTIAAGMTLVLAAWTRDDPPSTSPMTGRTSFSRSPPAWVRKELEGENLGTNRAVGIARRYYNVENSWTQAEERARNKLAFRVASKVRGLNKSTEDWRHDVRSLTTGVDLRRVQVRARWADDEHCYVLVEGEVEDILVK